ncbi:tripartite tricarboxylate transporter substrate-binding protein [Roseiarcaceae bacterium H3SJ34-1]|uniref:tripartite tricarboxylate transporter substrate-binding protein n=1 Tax=Terripilifer ovatus TaxID=3032367 RepID=UPI003AB930A3|nr:tripartite tricarboxylate transporter substrate-binding protein [Roseiarcaceae bacterium H3SJ34-1]
MFVIDGKRLAAFPDIPTTIELGYPQFDNMISTVFLMAPAAMPRPLLDKYHTALLRVQKDPVIVKMLDQLRLTPPPPDQSVADVTKLAAEQIVAWEKPINSLAQ